MATYRLDGGGILETEPVVLGDGSALFELAAPLRSPAASRAGVAVRSEPALPGAPEAALADLGDDELLVDVEATELAGTRAVRTLVLVQLGGVATTVLEQWRLIAAGERWVVTATADLALWPRLSGALRRVVATLEIEP